MAKKCISSGGAHKFMKVGNMWRCALPGCGWFIQKGLESMLMNRPAYCWTCEQTFAFDIGNLQQDKPICYGCSPILNALETMNPITGAVVPVKLNTIEITKPTQTYEEIQAEYERLVPTNGPYAANIIRNSKLKKLKEWEDYQRAQSTNEVEEDKPESEYIPPKYDVE